jgi:steroid delta-isomerase-like uncharacterized protein
MFTASNSEKNKDNFRKIIEEVINAGRLDLCDRYLAPDRVDHQDYGLRPEMANGHEGFKRVLAAFCGAFPDLHLEIQLMIAEGDRLASLITTTGTHMGPFMGVAPTGKTFKVNGTDFFRFNDQGKVAEHWGVFDTLGMMTQLGILPPPGQA